MDVRLTKDADALICVIYKSYLDKRNNRVPKGDAKMFGGSDDIHRDLVPKSTPEDTDETCWELHRSGLLSCFAAGNKAYFVTLADEGIIYMENRFKDGLKSVIEYINLIKGSIPFI